MSEAEISIIITQIEATIFIYIAYLYNIPTNKKLIRMSLKRVIRIDKTKKEVIGVLKSIGVKEYSLRTLKDKRIKISLKCNLETCRKILQRLE